MSDTTNTADIEAPPLPEIGSLLWVPPNQTVPIVRGTISDRLRLYANADSHDWQEWVPDIPNPNYGGPLLNYWDGQPPAAYTLTIRSYWQLVPKSYAQVAPRGGFTQQFASTVGISETDSQTISAELGVDVKGLSAKVSYSSTHSVTTSSQTEETTTHSSGDPLDGFTRVWMLWQLVDEIIALDAIGNVVSNPTRRGDVNWSEHNPSGAYLDYPNLHQHFPSDIIRSLWKDLPIS